MFPFCFLSLADKVLVDVDINIKPRDSWSLFSAFLPQKAKRWEGFLFPAERAECKVSANAGCGVAESLYHPPCPLRAALV